MNRRENLLLAMLFSFLVGVVGALVWGLIYIGGWYVSFMAFVTAFAMYKVYSRFASINSFTFAWILLLVILLNAVSTYFAIVIVVANNSNVSFMTSYNYIKEMFSLFKDSFFKDCAMGAIFGIIGVVSAHFSMKNKI